MDSRHTYQASVVAIICLVNNGLGQDQKSSCYPQQERGMRVLYKSIWKSYRATGLDHIERAGVIFFFVRTVETLADADFQ